MPVISPRRYSTTTGSTYLPPTSGTYRSTYSSTTSTTHDRGPSNYTSDFTSSYGSRSNYFSTNRSSLGNSGSSTSATTTSKYGGLTSKYLRTSADKELPPSGSTRYPRGDSRTRDRDLNSSGNTPSASLRLATTAADLYEKYSPSSYIPKCELTRSRSLSEAQKLTKEKTPTKDLYSSATGGAASSLSKYRNASSRTALPPSSERASKYYERERPSLTGRTLSDSDTFALSKSAFTSSSSLADPYDRGTSTETADGLCGLRNIGNTCFMNSVLQCLSHTNELTKFLRSQYAPKTSTKDQRILAEFVKLIKDMWSGSRSVTPLELKSAISSKYRMYSGSAQQDAQEFLRFFLDTLHCALNEKGTKGDKLEIDDNLSDTKKADLTWEWYSRVENSLVKDLFVGQLKSSLKCTVCGNTSVTFDPFWDLSLPLPSSTTRCKLESCLDLFIKEEVLDGDEMPTCSKCKTRRKSTKTFTIQRFPKYLVIHLKRFSETRWSKLTTIVEFPTGERELEMSPYASPSNTSSSKYTLYGISNHMGSTAGGHYVAVCKHPIIKKWHEFNDNLVSDSSDYNLVSSSAYLLFYERS